MSSIDTGRIWDSAASPAAVDLARRFELAWHAAPAARRPDVGEFLPENPSLRPGVLLALLRTEMALRFEAGESPRVEAFRQRYPDLDPDTLIALIYEEYCLREESGEVVGPGEYDARFPEHAPSLRRVLDIHSLVGPCPSTATHPKDGGAGMPVFPEAGQTIGGFHLVEEIGRGSFARVFQARERQLADRPVALKVSRTGSREPQALARLQHTHIVPVYSYRTDPLTGLHLLCMPYFGGLTLARVLADPVARDARDGAALAEALERLQPHDDRWGRAIGRLELAQRGFTEAIAWWGARMAEALQHAHDRGVLHRDVKPSNVLITADGLPMLLDFNLAQQPLDDAEEPDTLGGTLAYMAPEQLQALADGRADGIDGRSDVYALGVMLHEAVTGTRPFPNPREALTAREALVRAVADRQAGPPRLRDEFPEVPPAFEAVLRRCLASRPEERYAQAADLAADLQAVADDAPLRFAREPIPSRVVRWSRRHRLRLLFAGSLLLALFALGLWAHQAYLDLERLRAEVHNEVQRWMNRADQSYQGGFYPQAIEQLGEAIRIGEHARDKLDPDRPLLELIRHARGQRFHIEQEEQVRDRANALFQNVEPLYAELLDPETNARGITRRVEEALAPFYVFRNPQWAELEDLEALDAHGEPRRARLIAEIDELLFLWAIDLDRDGGDDTTTGTRILELCRRGQGSGPWRAMKARWSRRLGQDDPTDPTESQPVPGEEPSARICLQWALLRDLQARPGEAVAWLRDATRLDPAEFWPHYILAGWLERQGRIDEAQSHAEAALALRPLSLPAQTLRRRLGLAAEAE